MLIFFVIVNLIWWSAHVYVTLRLIAPLALRKFGRRLLYVLFGLGATLGSFVFFAGQRLEPGWALAYRWVAWTYIGTFSILFACTLARDLVLLALRAVRAVRRTSADPADDTRRRFLLRASSGAAVGVSSLLGMAGVRAARRMPEIVEVDIPIAGLPPEFDGYHIVQLSDIHVGETIDKDFILPIIEAVTTLAPDLVALTGDLVDGSVEALRADVSPLAYLRARDGVLCVTGNHEYYSGVEAWCAHFRELGMSVLNNQHQLVERKGKRLVIAGVTDLREGKNTPGHTSDPSLALRDAPPHDVRILLAHQPRGAFEAAKHGYALQLSGHTHGGQFFPWNLVVGLVQPVSQGLAKIDGMWVYVNRGTCYWGPPLRAGVPAEITSLKLRRA